MTRATRRVGAVLAALLWPFVVQSQALDVIGRFDWQTDHIAELSGLEVADGGDNFTAVSDRGWIVEGRFLRSDGRLKDVAIDRLLPVRDETGAPVSARRVGDQSDAEGLAIGRDGTIHVSFERWAHVSHFEYVNGPARYAPSHPKFLEMADNRQLEALAIRSDGAVFTFPEVPFEDVFPIFRLTGSEWVLDGTVPASDGFQLVGADFDDQDRLYILERKLVLGLWFQARIRRIDNPSAGHAETLWVNMRGEHGNLEGIALWRDDKSLRITVVSDNNAREDTPTQFLEFRMRD